MNSSTALEQQLGQLGRELTGDGQLSEQIMRRLVVSETLSRAPEVAAHPMSTQWRALAVLAASVSFCLGVWWLTRPTTVYAQMLAALSEAKTVHIAGWTREVVRKWPLEKPPAAAKGDGADSKYEMEAWYWTAADGMPCSYERQGPVVAIRRGGDMREFQEDADLTYIHKGGFSKDRVAEFGQLARYLTALQRPSLTKEELGRRLEDGRWVRGIRHIEGDHIEDIWIDEKASLPIRLSRQRRSSGEPVMEISFAIDAPVPAAVASYEPPQTKFVRHGGGDGVNEQWREYVAEIGERLQREPIDGPIAVLPREDGRMFANQWALLTPDAKYWVRPLDIDEYQRMTPAYFIHFDAATEDGIRRHGTWRLEKALHDIEMPGADLVYEAHVPWQEWVQFGLSQFGLEYQEHQENRTVWVATHDGRPLKPWQQVQPPVPYVVEGGVEKKGYVKPGIGYLLKPVTLEALFADFNRMIDREDLAADKPWIIDETGLPMPPKYDASKHDTYREYAEKVLREYLVATDAPYFVGHESLKMARDWYQSEFGITFVEEVRPVTVHVIQTKE